MSSRRLMKIHAPFMTHSVPGKASSRLDRFYVSAPRYLWLSIRFRCVSLACLAKTDHIVSSLAIASGMTRCKQTSLQLTIQNLGGIFESWLSSYERHTLSRWLDHKYSLKRLCLEHQIPFVGRWTRDPIGVLLHVRSLLVKGDS